MSHALVNEIRSRKKEGYQLIGFAFLTSKDLKPYLLAFEGFFNYFNSSKHYQIIILSDQELAPFHTESDDLPWPNYTITPDLLPKLDFFDIFLTLDWNPYSFDFPKRSIIVAFTHFFPALSFSDHIRSLARIYGSDLIDYHFIPSPLLSSETSAASKIVLQEMGSSFPADLRQEELCVIPGGYPKLDTYIRYCRGTATAHEGTRTKRILFAPTGLVNNDRTFPDFGVEITEALLNNFHDYKILFRPTPMDRGHAITRNLIQRFSSHDRFEVDMSDNLAETYASADIMVCDMTTARNSFSYSTLRPHIRCRFDIQPSTAKRIPLGYEVHNTSQLIHATRTALSDLDTFEQSIHNECDRHLTQQGDSVLYLARNIDYIAQRKKHPDWFYADKGKSGLPQTAEDYVPYINQFASMSINYIQWSKRICEYGLKRFPSALSLLALYSKTLFLMGRDDEARAIRDKCFSLDKHVAGQYIWSSTIAPTPSRNFFVSIALWAKKTFRSLIHRARL